MKAYETSVTYNVMELLNAMVDVSEYRIANSPKDYKQSLGPAKFYQEVAMSSFSLGRQAGHTQGVVEWCKRRGIPANPCLIIVHKESEATRLRKTYGISDHPYIVVASIHSPALNRVETIGYQWRVFIDGPVDLERESRMMGGNHFMDTLYRLVDTGSIKSLVKVGC